jgi:hypothetical protein
MLVFATPVMRNFFAHCPLPEEGSSPDQWQTWFAKYHIDCGESAGGVCYADCDASLALDVFDFLCFQNEFASLSAQACDCDTGTGAGMCGVFDFVCFQSAFAAGCP